MHAAYGEYGSVTVAADALPAERAAFIRRTYAHLAGAIGAFVALEYVLLQTGLGPAMLSFIGSSRFAWLMILGGFVAAGWVARSVAASATSRTAQYGGLALYVFAEAIIFVPILYIAAHFSSPEVIPMAAIVTGLLFAGLTTVVFITRKDFSFLGSILTIGGFVAMGLIVAGAVFGFTLGLAFAAVMILLASGAILYDTSRIMRTYPTDRYVGASLELFASIALLFWYVLRLFMSRR